MMSDESWPEEGAPDSKTRRNEQPMSPLVVIRKYLNVRKKQC